MPSRILRDYRDSVTMANLTDFQERLFVRMIMTADDFGRGLANNLHATCFQVSDISRATVMQAVEHMNDIGLVRLYIDQEGRMYYDIPKFGNTPRAKYSKCPSYDDCRQVASKLQASCMQLHVDCSSKPITDNREPRTENREPIPPSNTPPETAKRRAPGNTGGGYSEDFESFWAAYPRKAGKGAAWKAWRSAKMKPVQETILAAVQAAKGSDQWTKDGGQFIPHPATWINQARWDDVPTIASGQPAAAPEKPRSVWEIQEQIKLLSSERDRLNRSDFETTAGCEKYPEQWAKVQELNAKIRALRDQIAGKA